MDDKVQSGWRHWPVVIDDDEHITGNDTADERQRYAQAHERRGRQGVSYYCPVADDGGSNEVNP